MSAVLFLFSVFQEPKGCIQSDHYWWSLPAWAALMWHSWIEGCCKGWNRTAGPASRCCSAHLSFPSPPSLLPRPFGPEAPVQLQHFHIEPAIVTYLSPSPVKFHLHKPAFVSDDSPVFSLYLSTCRLILQSLSGQPQSKRQNLILWCALNVN